MHSDHEAVTPGMELPFGDNAINWSEHDFYQKHQEHALNTTNPNTTTTLATFDELISKLEDTMTSGALTTQKTTQNEQSQNIAVITNDYTVA